VVDEVDVGEIVEVPVGAGDEETRRQAGPFTQVAALRLLLAGVVHPLGQVGSAAAAVHQLELAGWVQGSEAVTGRAP